MKWLIFLFLIGCQTPKPCPKPVLFNWTSLEGIDNGVLDSLKNHCAEETGTCLEYIFMFGRTADRWHILCEKGPMMRVLDR